MQIKERNDGVLLRRVRLHHDENARETLVLRYLPMVKRIVFNQSRFSFDREDLIQEGLIGLLKAIKEFDSSRRDIKFSTFAYLCISRKVFNAIKYIYGNKQKALNHAVSLYTNSCSQRTLLEVMEAQEADPMEKMEDIFNTRRLEQIMRIYLSRLEFEVMRLIMKGISTGEIQQRLDLSPKRIDNARTRAKTKLKKIILRYGSLANPAIPLKTRKRNDLAIAF
ncbi:MAG: sigma-70 family RNA polymerase sigma factor [Bacillota bacterium]